MRRTKGFSLVEVMVALVVLSVGLLGMAKMQALALSNTTSARMRSIAALEAASLASTMSADRTYWTSITADPNVAFSAGAITSKADATLLRGTCPCTPAQIARQDLDEWLTDLNLQLPNAQGQINCAAPTGPPAPTPASCTIALNWTEKQVISNSQQTTAPATINYTLYVEP
jgi:type IV pilus assembly protein PilV